MKKFIYIFTIAIALGFSVQAQEIDTENSRVEFEITKLGMLNVEGVMKGMHGTVDFDPAVPEKAKFNVCIKAATVETGIDKRDEHLRTEDFFYVEKYPEICIESLIVSKTESGYVTKAELTILEVTREIEIPFTYENNTLKGSFTLNRFDYNLGEDTGTVMAGSEVDVTIICKQK